SFGGSGTGRSGLGACGDGTEDFVRARITRHDNPGSAAVRVMPQLAIGARGIVAQKDVINPGLERCVGICRAHRIGAAEIDELLVSALPAMRAWHAHGFLRQCRLGTAPRPPSSMTWPVAKRSRRKPLLSGWGLPVAMVWAKHQPEAGVALNPP